MARISFSIDNRCVEVSVQKNLPSNVARFEQLMYLSLGLAVIETILERDRFLAENDSVRLRLCGVVHLAGRARAQELGTMGVPRSVCGDTSRIPEDWSDFDRGDFARCSVLPRGGGTVSDLHRQRSPLV
jgi:hypothetical protein